MYMRNAKILTLFCLLFVAQLSALNFKYAIKDQILTEVNCPTNGPCNCSGVGACSAATVICKTHCAVECSGPQSCGFLNFTCLPGAHCVLNCTGEGSCTQLTPFTGDVDHSFPGTAAGGGVPCDRSSCRNLFKSAETLNYYVIHAILFKCFIANDIIPLNMAAMPSGHFQLLIKPQKIDTAIMNRTHQQILELFSELQLPYPEGEMVQLDPRVIVWKLDFVKFWRFLFLTNYNDLLTAAFPQLLYLIRATNVTATYEPDLITVHFQVFSLAILLVTEMDVKDAFGLFDNHVRRMIGNALSLWVGFVNTDVIVNQQIGQADYVIKVGPYCNQSTRPYFPVTCNKDLEWEFTGDSEINHDEYIREPTPVINTGNMAVRSSLQMRKSNVFVRKSLSLESADVLFEDSNITVKSGLTMNPTSRIYATDLFIEQVNKTAQSSITVDGDFGVNGILVILSDARASFSLNIKVGGNVTGTFKRVEFNEANYTGCDVKKGTAYGVVFISCPTEKDRAMSGGAVVAIAISVTLVLVLAMYFFRNILFPFRVRNDKDQHFTPTESAPVARY